MRVVGVGFARARLPLIMVWASVQEPIQKDSARSPRRVDELVELFVRDETVKMYCCELLESCKSINGGAQIIDSFLGTWETAGHDEPVILRDSVASNLPHIFSFLSLADCVITSWSCRVDRYGFASK